MIRSKPYIDRIPMSHDPEILKRHTRWIAHRDNQLRRLKNKPRITTMHEAYGLLLEELDEFWDDVKAKPSKRRDKPDIVKEPAQIAALAERTAIDLELV